jgi:DNA-directed RNA polymerase subunit RPC12/RpoP
MDVKSEPAARDPEAELVAFLAGRTVPCPRCGYDLRDIQTARCPECGEPLVLKVGSPRVRFGWLVLAMAPGCFSGVAAVFVLFPIGVMIWRNLPPGQGVPWPVMAGDAFGFLSAGSVVLMYRCRHRILAWPARRQGAFAGAVWGVHILMFVLMVLAIAFLR